MQKKKEFESTKQTTVKIQKLVGLSQQFENREGLRFKLIFRRLIKFFKVFISSSRRKYCFKGYFLKISIKRKKPKERKKKTCFDYILYTYPESKGSFKFIDS